MDNLPTEIKGRVTRSDLHNGNPERPCSCPIALSLRRTLNELGYTGNVDLHVGKLWLFDGSHFTEIDGVQFAMCETSNAFIDEFDGKYPDLDKYSPDEHDYNDPKYLDAVKAFRDSFDEFDWTLTRHEPDPEVVQIPQAL